MQATNVNRRDYVDMIDEKWLSGVIFTTVKSNANLSRVKTVGGDFNTASLSDAVNNEESNIITVRSWFNRASERKSTLIFCVDIAHVQNLCDMFRKHGLDAKYVTGMTPNQTRAEVISGFRDGQFPILLNCGVFTEGTDIPNVDCIILARPTKSRNLLIQMIGRGMRLHHGKTDCHVIDMVATIEGGVTTTPTLFGLDPDELIEEADADDLKRIRETKQKEQESRMQQSTSTEPSEPTAWLDPNLPINVKFTDYDSIMDLVRDTSGERHIRALSPNAWVCASHDRYILADREEGNRLTITLVPGEKEQKHSFQVKLNATYESSSSQRIHLRPRIIVTTETFESAVHAADTYASKHFLRLFIILKAQWRNQEATQGQVDFVNRFRRRPGEELLTRADLTKGQAADMIVKLKYGARGYMNQIQQRKRLQERSARKQHQEQQLARRQKVRVGPVSSAAALDGYADW